VIFVVMLKRKITEGFSFDFSHRFVLGPGLARK
jgi:hypothetical protein